MQEGLNPSCMCNVERCSGRDDAPTIMGRHTMVEIKNIRKPKETHSTALLTLEDLVTVIPIRKGSEYPEIDDLNESAH